MSLYDMTCLQDGGLFDLFNCLNTASSGVLIHVCLITFFAVVTAVFIGSGKNIKNVLLLSTTITALSAIIVQVAVAAGSYSSTINASYASASLVWAVLAFCALLYHVLSDL